MTRGEPINDYVTIGWDERFNLVADARRHAKNLSKQCPFRKDEQTIDAVKIICTPRHYNDILWSEIYVNGKLYKTFPIWLKQWQKKRRMAGAVSARAQEESPRMG